MNIKQNKLTALLLAVCMLPLTACSEHSSSEPVIPETTSAVTTLPETTTVTTTTTTAVPEPSLPPLHWEGETGSVHALHGIHEAGSIAALCPAGGTQALLAVTNERARKTDCLLVDMQADSVLFRISLKDRYETVLGYTPDGKVLTEGFEKTSMLNSYDPKTGECSSVEIQDMPYLGTLNYDRSTDTIYSKDGDCLCRIGRDGSNTKLFQEGAEHEPVHRVCIYDPATQRIIVEEPDGNDFTGLALAVRSLKDGSYFSKVCNFASNVFMTKSCLFRCETPQVNNPDYYYRASVFDLETGTFIRMMDPQSSYCWFEADPHAETMIVTDWDLESGAITTLKLLDPIGGKYADLEMPDGTFTTSRITWLTDCGSWVFGLSGSDQNGLFTALYAVDTENTPLSKDYPEGEPYGDAVVATIGDDMKDCRAKADSIEKKFGIRVLIGNEVENVQDPCDYRLGSTEDKAVQAISYWDGEITDRVSDALDKLDKELSLYPKGFFEKFKLSDGTGGLRIMLTLSLINKDEDSTFTAGGVQFNGSLWYNIAINLYMMSEDDMTVHHEMWHAVESLLEGHAISFPYEEWEALNPADFEYEGLEDYGTTSRYFDYTLTTKSGDNAYFARIYGTANEREDRATIIEAIFGNVWQDDVMDYVNGYEAVKRCPHIIKKLDCMAELVKQLFGYVYWEEILGSHEAASGIS